MAICPASPEDATTGAETDDAVGNPDSDATTDGTNTAADVPSADFGFVGDEATEPIPAAVFGSLDVDSPAPVVDLDTAVCVGDTEAEPFVVDDATAEIGTPPIATIAPNVAKAATESTARPPTTLRKRG